MAKPMIVDFSDFTNNSDYTKHKNDNASTDDFLMAFTKAKAMASLILELENNFMSENYNKKFHYCCDGSHVIVEATRLDENAPCKS